MYVHIKINLNQMKICVFCFSRFHEEREYGSCCYGFALTFINRMRSLDLKAPLSRNEFTSAHVLPRMKRASMYIKVYEEISQHGFYIVDK